MVVICLNAANKKLTDTLKQKIVMTGNIGEKSIPGFRHLLRIIKSCAIVEHIS